MDTTLFDQLEAGGFSPDGKERTFLRQRGRVQDYVVGDAQIRRTVLRDAETDIRALRASGWSEEELPITAPQLDSTRELLSALAAKAGLDELPPLLSISAKTPVGFYTGSAPEPLVHVVTICFDSRLPRRRLYQLLQENWSILKKRGIVRQSRRVQERSIALLRFVCLELPEASWKIRAEEWNRLHPKWRYEEPKAFVTDVHDAEKAITGKRDGLAWFYNPVARLSSGDLKTRAAAGARGAQQELDRRQEEGFRSLERAGIRVIMEGENDQAS